MTTKQTEAQYDEKFKQQAVELALPELSRGVSQRVVAEKLGVPFRRLNEWLIAAGQRFNKPYKKAKKGVVKEARTLRRHGISVEQIATRLGYHPSTIRRWCRKMRIQPVQRLDGAGAVAAIERLTKQAEDALFGKSGLPLESETEMRRQITELRDENSKLKRDLAGFQLGESVDFDVSIPEKVYNSIVTDAHIAYVRSLIVGAYLDGKFK